MLPTPSIPDLTLLRRIGGGSYGDVWLARTLTGVYRAVKVVERARFPDERPFLRELEGITQFQRLVGDRPRQLALMHVGQNAAAGLLYYVMELADDVATGTDIDPDRYVPLTLKALQERLSILPAAECVRFGVELSRSLVELHDAGLVHRDVKLSNVIFVAGVPKLADIGLVSSSDHTLTALGTPGFSPEEGAGTRSADVYGLGKILYVISTGLPPGAFPRLAPETATLPDASLRFELNDVILRACDPDPRKRHRTVSILRDELLLLQAGRSIKELHRTRARLRVARQVASVAVLTAVAFAAVFGAQNHLNLRKLAAHEAGARIAAEADERTARYTADLHRALLNLYNRDTGLARAALRRQIPSAGATDSRGLEWNALWNEAGGDEWRVLGSPGGPPVREIALASDGVRLAAQEGDTLRDTVLWNLDQFDRSLIATETLGLGGFAGDGTEVIVGLPAGGVRHVAVVMPDLGSAPFARGRVAAIGNGGQTIVTTEQEGTSVAVRWWQAGEDREVATWISEPEFGPARLAELAVSPDGTLLAVSMFESDNAEARYELQVWERGETWTCRFRRGDFFHLHALTFAPDGRHLALAGSATILTVIDTRIGQTVRELPGHHGNILDLAFSPDGHWLASAGEDLTIRLWNAADGTPGRVLRGHEGATTALVWRSVDELISASVDGTIRIWRPPAPPRCRARPGFWYGFRGDFVYAPDGSTIAISDGEGRLREIDPHTLAPGRRSWDASHPLAFVTGSWQALSNELELIQCDRETGTVRRTGLRMPPTDRVVTATGSADGRFALLGTGDGTVEFWNCRDAISMARGRAHTGTIFAGSFSPSGDLAVTGDTNGSAWLWEATSGTAVAQLGKTAAAVFAVGISQTGHVAIGREDGSLTIVDAASRTVVAQRIAHSRGLGALAYSPDGTRLFTAGYDGVVVAWSVPEYREMATLPISTMDPGEVQLDLRPALLHVAPDSTHLAAFTENGWLRAWDLRHPVP